MKIDCAHNSELAEELATFLTEKGYLVNLADDILSSEKNISKKILELFLKETHHGKHKIIPFDSNSYVLAIPKSLEDIGLESCEFCGYTGYSELVAIHRRSHQAL